MLCGGQAGRIAALLALLGTCVSSVGCQTGLLLPVQQSGGVPAVKAGAASLETVPNRRTARARPAALPPVVESTPLNNGVPVSEVYREPIRSGDNGTTPPALIQTKAEAPRKATPADAASLDIPPMMARAQPPRAEPMPPAEDVLPAPRVQEAYAFPPDMAPPMLIPAAYPPDPVNP